MQTIKYLATVLATMTCICTAVPQKTIPDIPEDERWTFIADDVTTTVYHAVPSQCNDDCLHTASMLRIDPSRIGTQRIMAMERTMMAEYGIRYGDIVRIEGTGAYDGEWQVQDTMKKRFAGQHKIDLLIPQDAAPGRWTNITIYKASNQTTKDKYMKKMKQS